MKHTALVFAISLVAAGCGPKKVDKPPTFDADANSGPDGKRSGAVPIEANKISPPDEVNYDKQDMTDWKSVELRGKPALLEVELHWDNANSDLNVDIFDGFGTQIATGPGLQPGAQKKTVTAQIDTVPGVYYLRVQAPKKGDGSVYTLEAKWAGAVEEPPKPPEPVVEKTPPPKPKEHHEHKPRGPKEFSLDNGVQGRIVSSYREGGSMVLHID